MRLCDYCLGGMAVLPVLEIGELVFCDVDCAERHIRQGKAAFATANARIAELQAKLRAWEETAEHYCKADTPISPDGVRGYIAELEAQLAAKDARIAELEAQLGGNVFARTEAAINELGRALGVK